MTFFAHHAIRKRINLEEVEALANEDIPFTSGEEVEEACRVAEKLINESDDMLKSLYEVSRLMTSKGGLTTDTVDYIEKVVGESVVSKEIRSVLSSQPSEAYFQEVMVATEAISRKFKFGIIMALIGIIIKIINWIISQRNKIELKKFNDQLATVPNKVETSDKFVKIVEAGLKSEIFRKTFWKMRPEFGDGKSDSVEYSNILLNIINIEHIFDSNLFTKVVGNGRKRSLLDALLEDRGLNLAERAIRNGFKYEDMTKTLTYTQVKRFVIRTLIEENIFATALSSKDSNVEDAGKLWYATKLGKEENSMFWIFGRRLFTSDAFDYFITKDHAEHLNRLCVQLDMFSRGLNQFVADYNKQRKYPFPDEVGHTPLPYQYRLNPPRKYDYRLPTLQEAPLIWAPVYIHHVMGEVAMGVRHGPERNPPRFWFNEYITYTILNPRLLSNGRTGNGFVLTSVNHGGGYVQHKDYTAEQWEAAVTNTHEKFQIDNIINSADGPLDLYDLGGDVLKPTGLKSRTLPAAIYVPTKMAVMSSATTDLSDFDKWPDHLIDVVDKASMIYPLCEAADLSKSAGYDPSKYEHMYKKIGKGAETLLAAMRNIEKTAKAGGETVIATSGLFHFPESQLWISSLALVWEAYDQGKLHELSIKIGKKVEDWPDHVYFWNEVGDTYSTDAPWSSLRDTLETAKIIGKIGGRVKEVQAEIARSPLMGLKV